MRKVLTRRVKLAVWQVAALTAASVGLGVVVAGETTAGSATEVEATGPAPGARPAGTSTTTVPVTAETTTTTAARRWVEVASASGATDKRTASFHLTGAEARLRFRHGAGEFSVYLMAEGDSVELNGGFPEVSCATSCQDETRLVKREGDYYLDVRAVSGAWNVVVEELR